MFIYLDESGDLGFDYNKKKTTNKFVVTLLVCKSANARKAFEKAVRRTLKNRLNRGKKERIITELKGTKTTLPVKQYFFRHIDNNEWGIYTLALNKRRVNANLRTKPGKEKLYNYLSNFLLQKLPLTDIAGNVELVVDRRKTKAEIKDFNQYLGNQLRDLLPPNSPLIIRHLNSAEASELQAVDLFCWGVFRKYEQGDASWYNIFQAKIKFETEYLR
jgi:hypothetical protein